MPKDIYILPENNKTKKANGVFSLLSSQEGIVWRKSWL